MTANADVLVALAQEELLWSERIEQQGRFKGKIEGKIEMLLRQFRVKFGEPPLVLVTRLKQIQAPATLDILSEQILTVNSLAELVWPEPEAEHPPLV